MSPSFASGAAQLGSSFAQIASSVAQASAQTTLATANAKAAELEFKAKSLLTGQKIGMLVWGGGALPTSTNALEVKSLDGINISADSEISKKIEANKYISLDQMNSTKQILKAMYKTKSNKIQNENKISLSASKDNIVQFQYELNDSISAINKSNAINTLQIPKYLTVVQKARLSKSDKFNELYKKSVLNLSDYIFNPDPNAELWKSTPYVENSALTLTSDLEDLNKSTIEKAPAYNSQDITYINMGKPIELYLGYLEQQNENNFLNLQELKLADKCEVVDNGN
ncbi:hypothetical protein V6259_18115 [Marinomonas sp. TI.3.20]|uniref:hypothetical protein n=1 Tax=Marinomonas sp. TI.3.20 TaxID=3121296 RepID=UPI00311EB3AF